MTSFNFLFKKDENNRNTYFGLFLFILFALAIISIFAYGSTYKGDDFYFHFRRLNVLIDAFRDHTFPAYIDYKAINGYGYLSNTFYSDVILIPFAVLGIVTNSYFAYNTLLFTMTILCGIFMYKAVNTIYTNSFAASISALLYTFCSYRLFDEYYRAALGEYIAFTFLPILFLGCYHIIKGDYKKWYILAIGYILLIFTHVLSSLLVFIILVIFLLIYYKSILKEPKRIAYLILAGLVTLVSVSYYLLPMVEQLLDSSFYFQTQAWMLPIHHRLDLETILLGMVSITTVKGLPIMGLVLTIVIFLRIFVKEKSNQLKSIDIFVIFGLICVSASSALCPWGRFPLSQLSVIQFPWRLFTFASFFFAIAGGYYLSRILKSQKRIITLLLSLFAILSCIIFIDGRNYTEKHKTYRTHLEKPNKINHYLGGGLEYIPSKTPALDFTYERGDTVIALKSKPLITHFGRNERITRFNVVTTTKNSLEVPLLYYKGYKATINDKEIPVAQSALGYVQIPIDESGKIEVYYEGTAIQKISFYISIISIFTLCAYIRIQRKRDYHHKSEQE